MVLMVTGTAAGEYRESATVLPDNQKYRVAEGDVDNIHRWRQPIAKAVDRCWVCVGVCGKRAIHFVLATHRTHPYWFTYV